MKRIPKIISSVLLALLLVLTLFPFYLLIINSFKVQADIIKTPFTLPSIFHLENYAKAWPQVVKPMLNSFLVTIAVVVFTLVVSSLASYAFMKYRKFRGKEALYYGIIALLMVPGFVMLIPQFVQITRLGLYNTYWGLILPQAAYQVAMGTFLLRTSMEAIPRSMIECAEIEGAGDLTILTRLVLPLSKPTLATVLIMTGLGTWNNYNWPLVATTDERKQVISLALTKLVVSVQEGNGVLFAAYIIASLPLVILFCFASKHFVAGITRGAVKG